MPLDIYDKNGDHLGIIIDRYLDEGNVYMIAITDLTTRELSFDEEKMKKYLAGLVKIKNIFGKVDEDRLKDEMEKLRIPEGRQSLQQLPYDDFMKYVFLKNYSDKSIEEYLEIKGLPEEKVKGYVLLNINKIEINNGKLCIDEDMDYISDEIMDTTAIPKNNSLYLIDQREDDRIYNIKPIFAKVTGYPVFETDIMGFGEGFILGGDLADLGGRNHSHQTILRIKSGSFEDNIVLPIIVFAKKDMQIKLFIKDRKIKMVFCDGIIYRL